jgi:hypothetical protein
MEGGGVFPLVTLNQTKRGYLVSVGRQMNGCYAAGWYDGCAVMMRRLLNASTPRRKRVLPLPRERP